MTFGSSNHSSWRPAMERIFALLYTCMYKKRMPALTAGEKWRKMKLQWTGMPQKEEWNGLNKKPKASWVKTSPRAWEQISCLGAWIMGFGDIFLCRCVWLQSQDLLKHLVSFGLAFRCHDQCQAVGVLCILEDLYLKQQIQPWLLKEVDQREYRAQKQHNLNQTGQLCPWFYLCKHIMTTIWIKLIGLYVFSSLCALIHAQVPFPDWSLEMCQRNSSMCVQPLVCCLSSQTMFNIVSEHLWKEPSSATWYLPLHILWLCWCLSYYSFLLCLFYVL